MECGKTVFRAISPYDAVQRESRGYNRLPTDIAASHYCYIKRSLELHAVIALPGIFQ
jgi:hypothetical protein